MLMNVYQWVETGRINGPNLNIIGTKSLFNQVIVRKYGLFDKWMLAMWQPKFVCMSQGYWLHCHYIFFFF